jgi:uncharacterized protein (DUF983 family)
MIEISSAGHQHAHPRSVWDALKRGGRQTCPACGSGALYSSYLKVNAACPGCGEELHHHRADDAPPYFTMTIVGHVVVAGDGVIWLPLLVLMSLWLLPRVKGALVGLQWALRMHGFAGPDADDTAKPAPAAS